MSYRATGLQFPAEQDQIADLRRKLALAEKALDRAASRFAETNDAKGWHLCADALTRLHLPKEVSCAGS